SPSRSTRRPVFLRCSGRATAALRLRSLLTRQGRPTVSEEHPDPPRMRGTGEDPAASDSAACCAALASTLALLWRERSWAGGMHGLPVDRTASRPSGVPTWVAGRPTAPAPSRRLCRRL